MLLGSGIFAFSLQVKRELNVGSCCVVLLSFKIMHAKCLINFPSESVMKFSWSMMGVTQLCPAVLDHKKENYM